MKELLAYSILLFSSLNSVIACSLIYQPATLHNDYDFIFEGTVIGYVKSDSMFKKEAWGYQVIASNIVYAPSSIDTVAVFDFGLTPACTYTPLSLEVVKERFSPGTEVKVVGKINARLNYPNPPAGTSLALYASNWGSDYGISDKSDAAFYYTTYRLKSAFFICRDIRKIYPWAPSIYTLLCIIFLNLIHSGQEGGSLKRDISFR